MTAQQRIIRVRRQYNQWVANQTLEDYALRFTATSARRWSAWGVCLTALGSITFLALEAIGGTITLSYGFHNAVAAIAVVSLIIFVMGLPITYYAARYGVDIDLLTRGAGFGYIGSTITSLIYASFTFIFFALEAVILAMAFNLLFGLPTALGYLLASLGIIPLVTHGITFIGRLQRWTQPVWLTLQILPLAYISWRDPSAFDAWSQFPGPNDQTAAFSWIGFGCAASVAFSLVAQIGEQVDFLRFLPPRTSSNRMAWWLAVLTAGPGWVVIGALKLLAGSFLAVLALRSGIAVTHAGEPARMYLAAFGHVIPIPALAALTAGLFILLAQVKINVTNAYAGSIAWSNFFSRLTHSHPGRVVWLVFNVAIALLLMEFGIYEGLEQILTQFSILATAWLATIFADLVISKPLGWSPAGIEFRRAYLYDINPVGLSSMALSAVIASLAQIGLFGDDARAFAVFLALVTPLVCAPALAWITRGRFYLARPLPETAEPPTENHATVRCCICEYEFEPEDMAHCPAYGGHICSLCCSLDARCHDGCKHHARFPDQFRAMLRWLRLPQGMIDKTFAPLAIFLAIALASLSVVALVLCVIYFQTTLHPSIPGEVLANALLKVFAAMVIVTGVVTWLLVLARDSRRVAEEESRRQTALLMEEIEAHQRTDTKLQKAKEVAEAANLAKTRYVVGISHELRAPLNAIFGYAQLLEGDPTFPPHRRDALRVIRRSSEHLSGLIEGLLDISKIEAGHLRLSTDNVRLPEFLDQIVGMFRLQAQEKGIYFHFDPPAFLPAIVHADEKRLRQILINLLSNALKFTDAGGITFRVRYNSSQLAEFEFCDTGIGIRPEDLERIFEPFERGPMAKNAAKPGMGLGLTITKLLTEILGGEISVVSEPGQGSRFRVKLMLSEMTDTGQLHHQTTRITGYHGRQLTVLAADDDPAHLSLTREVLVPLGFRFLSAPDGATCLSLAEQFHPDLFLLDISMPDANGWELARILRQRGYDTAAIIMVSANALEYRAELTPEDVHDDFILKPLDISILLDKIAQHLGVQWMSNAQDSLPPRPAGNRLAHRHLRELRQLAEIGYMRGIRSMLDRLERDDPGCQPMVTRLRGLAESFDVKALNAALDLLLAEEDPSS